MSSRPIIRVMQPSELQLVLDWAAQEGWNPGLHDATAFYNADPSGFLIAELQGEPIGCISAMRYNAQFGFIGLYIVQPQYRGCGYGMQLWSTAWHGLTDRLEQEGASIGLDGVLEREATYRQAGFRAAYRHIRHASYSLLSDGVSSEVVPLKEIPLDVIMSYDAQLFPAARPQFLEPWIRLSKAAYGVMEHGRLVGYGVLRTCREGFKIGPLFAETLEIADSLFRSLVHHCEGKPVFIDIPDINPDLPVLVERYGLQPVFTCVRMYWGNEPTMDPEHIFGVTTLELG
ncbi:MAG TPA: GNAT family N-acetyltransferase [Stenomitos sp.]